jgi:hypothetical protein
LRSRYIVARKRLLSGELTHYLHSGESNLQEAGMMETVVAHPAGQAEAEVLAPEPRQQIDRGIREQTDATATAVAVADRAFLYAAIGTVSWERRGLFERLTRRT